jgi:hypothetical protein
VEGEEQSRNLSEHLFTDENDQTGEPHLVVVSRGLGLKFLDFIHTRGVRVHLHEPGVVPAVDWRFQVEATSLTDASLTEALEWAYRHYVLRYLPAFAAEAEQPTKVAG